MAEGAVKMGTEMWKWGEGTGGRGDYAHNSQEVRGRSLPVLGKSCGLETEDQTSS